MSPHDDIIVRPRLRLIPLALALALACGSADGPDLREHMTGMGSDLCNAPNGPGMGHGSFYEDADVLVTYEDDRVEFDRLLTLVCPLVGTHDAGQFTFPSQDCTAGNFDELDIRGTGEWQNGVLVLELESDEYHAAFDDPSGPRYPVPCEHHHELTPVE